MNPVPDGPETREMGWRVRIIMEVDTVRAVEGASGQSNFYGTWQDVWIIVLPTPATNPVLLYRSVPPTLGGRGKDRDYISLFVHSRWEES
jgi:hypothetical protein